MVFHSFLIWYAVCRCFHYTRNSQESKEVFGGIHRKFPTLPILFCRNAVKQECFAEMGEIRLTSTAKSGIMSVPDEGVAGVYPTQQVNILV
jgi:hypothetical protein